MPDWVVRASTRLEIKDRDTWDGSAAKDRVLEKYSNEDGKINSRKAPRAFLLYDADSDGNDKQDYKFPIADVVNGELVAITEGIIAADSRIGQGPEGAPQEEMQEVINTYRRRSADLSDPDEEDSSPRQEEVEEFAKNAQYQPHISLGESKERKSSSPAPKTRARYERLSNTFRSGIAVKDVDVKTRTVTGYFASFNDLDADDERFSEDAFDESIREHGPNSSNPRIKHLYQHSPEALLGMPEVLKADQKGLYFETPVIDTRLGTDVLKMYEEDLLEHSVGFIRKGEEQLDDGSVLITKAKLFEGSSVTWGANPNTPFQGFKKSFEDLDSFADYLSDKAQSMRSLLKENMSSVALEQIELGLRQLESDLQKLETMMSDEGEDEEEEPTPEEAQEKINWPPEFDLSGVKEEEEDDEFELYIPSFSED